MNRNAGPGAIPQNDWFAAYEDYLVAGQQAVALVRPGGDIPIHQWCRWKRPSRASIGNLTSTIVDVIWKALPVFTSSAAQGMRLNRPTRFVVAAIDPAGNDPVSITAGSPPAGATFNSATRTFDMPYNGSFQPPVRVQFTAQYTNFPSTTPPKQTDTIGLYPGSSGTDPNNKDTDGDGFSDIDELLAGTDPTKG